MELLIAYLHSGFRCIEMEILILKTLLLKANSKKFDQILIKESFLR